MSKKLAQITRRMEPVRKPWQGLGNIIRFNWHFFALALLSGIALLSAGFLLPGLLSVLAYLAATAVLTGTLLSLSVSAYVYDCSRLYAFDWLNDVPLNPQATAVNVHAGFDETSHILQYKFALRDLVVFDFYDPLQHTEISIRRAREAYPPYPGTQAVTTTRLPLPDASAGAVFIIFAAHEIRDAGERVAFFKEIRRILQPGGRVIVVEHLRDAPNFIAYNIGCFHFLPRSAWLSTFRQSGLAITQTFKVTPFITTFILVPHGDAS